VRRFTVSRRAKRDLDEIWMFVARRDGVAAAEALLDQLGRCMVLCADMPNGGTDRGKFEPGLRSYPCGNHLVFFVKTRRGVRIAHVVHGARDLDRLFRRADERRSDS
jgi:toxin ParE1/3/4